MILLPQVQALDATRNLEMTGTYLNYFWVALAVMVVFSLLIWWGWRGRKRRQSAIAAPADVPAETLEEEPEAAAEGMVIGTVYATDYLDRIAVHELGLRTTGRIEVHSGGIAIFRSGARNWFIPSEDLTGVRTDRGMVGKFVERDGAVMIGWRISNTLVETGFRPRHAHEAGKLVTAAQRLTPQSASPESPDA